MATIKNILILLAICSEKTIAQEEETCVTTSSMCYQVQWPSTTNWTLSSPPCVNEEYEFLYRECHNGQWNKEPECFYVQSETPPQCPEDFIDSDEFKMCYRVSKQKSKFPPECPFEDILPFNDYVNVIDNVGPVWMPVRRDLSTGLGFLQWIEASSLYRTDFESDYVWKTIKDKDCLLYYNKSYIEAVSCDEEHLSVCAYRKLDQNNQLCSNEGFCHRSDFTATSKCFCLGTSPQQESYPKAEFLKLYQNGVYTILTNDTCAIGLEKTSNGTYIWSNSKSEINYTFWSNDVVFDDKHTYGASTANGWILTENPVSCFVFEKELEVSKPFLALDSKYGYTSLILMVHNFEGLKMTDSGVLLYCFTNADDLNLLYRYPSLTQTKTNEDSVEFTFEALEDGPGQYWCEAFNSFDLQVVKSNVINLRQQWFTYDFAAILKIVYVQEINPLSKDIFEFLRKTLFSDLDTMDDIKNYTYRIMNILNLDEDNNEIYVNVHFTSNFINYGDYHDSEYQKISTSLKEKFKQMKEIKIEMIDFLSTDYCMPETKRLNWPKAPADSTATPEEYCFKPDGSRLTRLCKNDLVNGAQWSEVDENCEIFNRSSVTQNLESLKNEGTSVIEDLLPISQQHANFTSVDLYLVGEILAVCASFEAADLCNLSEIVSNLLEIDVGIFMEAQLKMRAADNILHGLDLVIGNNLNSANCSSKNFYMVKGNTKYYSGLIISQDNLQLLVGKLDIVDVQSENATSAVWLSREFMEKIDLFNYNLIIMVFLKDSLFIEKSTETETFGNVFKITLPLDVDYVTDPVFILEKIQNKKKYSCSSWDYSFSPYMQGFWRNEDLAIDSSSDMYCKFSHRAHLAFTHNNRRNVTENLVEILESNSSTTEIVAGVHRLSARYEEFASIDVYLVGKILEKVNEDEEIDLEALAETVSNMHRIQREILLESQMQKRATDIILHYIDRIIMNHRYHAYVEVISDNLIIVISDIKKTNFSGLALLEFNQTFQLRVLESDVEVGEVANFENLNSAVVLSSELKNQLVEDTKVIITLFSNDAFFNEKKPGAKHVSNIFGVILPDIAEYSKPVSVVYKATENDHQEQCAHWSYNERDSGFWFKDQEGEHLHSVVNCEFWHTTHFALLLLDEDYPDGFQNEILDWITNINCIISLVSLLCIILTAVFFKKWRKNTGNKILLNFVIALILQMGLLYISNTVGKEWHSDLTCTIIGVLLHYSTLSEFCWMLVVAYLQHNRFVKIFGGAPEHIVLKACLCGWILPLFPVISLLLFDRSSYIHSKVGLCYPSGLGLHLGVWLPIFTIIAINFIVFLHIIYSVFYKKTECVNVGDQEKMLQWRLAVMLFFMLGLTWTFGFLSLLNFGTVFLYLFAVTSTLQGFMLFVFFIIFNINTKYLYLRALKRCCDKKY